MPRAIAAVADLFGETVETIAPYKPKTDVRIRGKEASFAIPKYDTKKFGEARLYAEWMCVVAYEVMTEGRTQAAVAARLDVTQQCISKWQDEHPEFKEAMERGKAVAEDLWAEERWKEMHPTVWKAQMANRFGWRDKNDSVTSGNIGFSLIQNLAGLPPPEENETGEIYDG